MKLQDVLAGDLCSGCGLCASLLGPTRATMRLAGAGYLRPVLSDAPTDAEQAVIGEVCPGSRLRLPEPTGDAAPEWGPTLSVQTAYARDDGLRQAASSGGALSAILDHLLVSGRARCIHQITADPEVPWLNTPVDSTDGAGIRRASGSRYAPSAPLADIVGLLERGEPFAVVGKPCDISALRAYARRDPRVDALVVATVAFMCGGVPSETGVRLLIERMGADPADVRAFRFRGDGWPGLTAATLRDGSVRSLTYAQSWGEVLSKHVQLRCKICADGVGMSADIVCADAWYGDERGYPTFEEQEGRSLLLARTPRGLDLVRDAVAAGRLATEPLDPRAIDRMQPYQMRRTRLTLSRLVAMRLAGRRTPRYVGVPLRRFARRAGLQANLRSFLGALARAARGRL